MAQIFNGDHWMGSIAGGTLLSALSIPGTHESCARYGGVAFECQTLTVAEQLDLGIRCFDIRCRHYYDHFPIHHSDTYEHLDFGEVMDACIAFLRFAPRECIILSIMKEYDDAGNTQTFQQTLESYISNVQDYWYLGDTIPTLDQVRGKIILLRRFEADNTPLGIDATNWPDNTTFFTDNGIVSLAVEDYYYIYLWSISDKWSAVSNHIALAAADDAGALFITFCSASGGIAPVNMAKGIGEFSGINQTLRDKIAKMPGPARVGIVMLDYPEYPDNSLVASIANLNQFLPLDYRRVDCIRKPEREDKRHAIRWLGGTELPSGVAFQMSELDVIDAIRAGERFIVVGNDGSEADVRVYSHQEPWETSPQMYLATEPDRSKADNLLSLPECPLGGLDRVR